MGLNDEAGTAPRGDDPPRRVLQMSITTGEPHPAAEIAWSAEVGVEVTVLDEAEAVLARSYVEDGVPSRAQGRMVTADEGPAFLQALLDLPDSSYTWFVAADEPATPLGHDEARARAETLLDRDVRPTHDEDVVVVDRHTQESGGTWAFVYNTRSYLETGSVSDMLVGNGPVLVDKLTGEARLGRSDLSVAEQI